MATKLPKNIKIKPGECTEFHLHKSLQTSLANSDKDLIDYTEHRLTKFINEIEDKQQQLLMVALLKDYIDGQVAIAWNKGNPVWIKITKD